MKINLGSLLRLFGVDLSQPLVVIEEIAQLVGQPALASELKNHVTPARAAELAAEFTKIATACAAQDWESVSTDLLDVLSGIKT